jgi:D-amino-acid dehydrogenase
MRGQIRFGGTLALSGYDPSIDRRRVQPLLNLVPTYLPGTDPAAIPTAQVWSGFRPATPDGLPLIGRAATLDNLTIATGHAMLGLTMAPITGKLVAEILTDQPPSLDLAPLRVERFG